jgi:NADH-quinone oxidoreductase subunit A
VTFGSTAPVFGGGSASVLAAGLSDYLPILLMAILAVVFAVASLGASALLRPHRPNRPKLSAYESGNDAVRLPGGERFGVKFYVVAMLFIIFDIETIFLFPWAVTFRELGLFGLIEMAVFIALVFVAYVYIWRKGGLDWSTAPPELRDEEEDEAGPLPARGADEEVLGAR